MAQKLRQLIQLQDIAISLAVMVETLIKPSKHVNYELSKKKKHCYTSSFHILRVRHRHKGDLWGNYNTIQCYIPYINTYVCMYVQICSEY